MGKYDMTIGAPLDFDDLLSSLTDESAFIFWLSASSETRDDDDGTKQAKIAENRAMVFKKKKILSSWTISLESKFKGSGLSEVQDLDFTSAI